MQIFLTWIEKRPYLKNYGSPCVCNWTSQGNNQDLKDATQYARVNGYRVFSFPESIDWRTARSMAYDMTLKNQAY